MKYLRRLHHNISDSNVEMEFRKGAISQDGFNRIPGSAIWSAVKIRGRFANSIDKEIFHIRSCSFLQ